MSPFPPNHLWCLSSQSFILRLTLAFLKHARLFNKISENMWPYTMALWKPDYETDVGVPIVTFTQFSEWICHVNFQGEKTNALQIIKNNLFIAYFGVCKPQTGCMHTHWSSNWRKKQEVHVVTVYKVSKMAKRFLCRKVPCTSHKICEN